ncbi:hypothetical protein CLV97_13817 [Planifilum fimeticola]|jgi:hypothetical protein|uniref:Uncharacterized protein n=1 Tax=Planifilum fimeticola TaxID=201975 RepID=A0A2T0LAC0_9BACL|nr:hypothetical protein [Planifilum fimeticola]PRX38753.1 hypothetical protein CLV97_13817 [Planifilum fimeticola]
MPKKQMFTASEIQKFCYCQEQFRLEKLEEQGKLHWPQEPDTHRLEEGIEYHKHFRQREVTVPKSQVLLIGLGVVFGLLCLALMIH